MNQVKEFRGTCEFMSNMYPSMMKLGSVTYTCAEAAFQAVKIKDKKLRGLFSYTDGKKAKELGRKVNLRPDWEKIKLDVMRWVIREKFTQNPSLRLRLLQRMDDELIEGNTWGDTFWGVCRGEGENWLGKILMEYRDQTYNEYLASLPELPGYKPVHKKDVPQIVKDVSKYIFHEGSDAGYEVKKHIWRKGEYYELEFWDENPIGEIFHHVFLITYDGNEWLQFDL